MAGRRPHVKQNQCHIERSVHQSRFETIDALRRGDVVVCAGAEEAKSSTTLEPAAAKSLSTLEVYGDLSPSSTNVLGAAVVVYGDLSPSSTSVLGGANRVKCVESTTAASGP